MSPGWVLAAFVGWAAFVGGLACAATLGQDAAGRFRASARRWLVLAAGGLICLLVALRLAGVQDAARSYPQWSAR